MSKNKRLSYEEKLKICELYDKGEGTHRSLAKQFGIDKTTIQQLYFKYKIFGAETLHMKRTHQSYTETFKHIVVASYKNGEGSYYDLAIKYGIDNPSLIARWVLGYNNIKTTHSGSGGINIVARKTTLEERIKIVEYLIKRELDYHGTAALRGIQQLSVSMKIHTKNCRYLCNCYIIWIKKRRFFSFKMRATYYLNKEKITLFFVFQVCNVHNLGIILKSRLSAAIKICT